MSVWRPLAPLILNIFKRAVLSSLRALLECTGPHLQDASRLAGFLDWRSERLPSRLLDHWKGCLTGEEFLLLGDYNQGVITTNQDEGFPSITICSGPDQHSGRSLNNATGTELSVLLVEDLNREKLQRRRPMPLSHQVVGEEEYCEW